MNKQHWNNTQPYGKQGFVCTLRKQWKIIFFSSNFLFLVLSGEKKTNPSYPNHAIIQSPPELPFPKPNQRKIWVPNYLFLLIPENQRNEMQNKTSPRKKKKRVLINPNTNLVFGLRETLEKGGFRYFSARQSTTHQIVTQ